MSDFAGKASLEAAAEGWDAAVAAMVHEDGTPVALVANVNPYRQALERMDRLGYHS